MNIFFLSTDPRTCAVEQCDQHVRKMIIEYAQMLSTAHRVVDGYSDIRLHPESGRKQRYWSHPHYEDQLYKATHVNNKLSLWIRKSEKHYMWLYQVMVWLNHEFVTRHQKSEDHMCLRKLRIILAEPPQGIKDLPWEDPPQAMPDQFKVPGDTIQAYRNFYIGDKIEFATYTRRDPPNWYKPYLRLVGRYDGN